MKQYFSFLFTTMVVIIIGFIGLIEGTITLLASEQNPQTPIVNREKVLYTSEVLSVTQIEAEIIVKNISKFSIAVRISWDGHDPNGIGKGKDSSLHSNVAPDMKISREFKDHTSVQLWAWNRSGQLIDSCNIRISTSIGNILYTGSVLLVGQTGSKIVIENISSSPVAIRISWDGNDPHGFGKGEDSVLHNNVSPTMRISQNFNKHTSVQIWAWDLSGKLKDACDKPLIGISTSAPRTNFVFKCCVIGKSNRIRNHCRKYFSISGSHQDFMGWK